MRLGQHLVDWSVSGFSGTEGTHTLDKAGGQQWHDDKLGEVHVEQCAVEGGVLIMN